jgi:hypothetical protein
MERYLSSTNQSPSNCHGVWPRQAWKVYRLLHGLSFSQSARRHTIEMRILLMAAKQGTRCPILCRIGTKCILLVLCCVPSCRRAHPPRMRGRGGEGGGGSGGGAGRGVGKEYEGQRGHSIPATAHQGADWGCLTRCQHSTREEQCGYWDGNCRRAVPTAQQLCRTIIGPYLLSRVLVPDLEHGELTALCFGPLPTMASRCPKWHHASCSRTHPAACYTSFPS